MGTLIRDLVKRAGVPVHEAGRLTLIAAADAPAFLDACLAAGCLVLGVDGFTILDHGEVKPDMAAIADFSGVDDVSESVAEANRFLADVDDRGLAFEFTIAGDDQN